MKVFLLALALVGFFTLPKPIAMADAPTPVMDVRAVALGQFFEKYKCPQPYYIDEYIKYADEYKIDYRLVAAVSLRESTCGRHYRYNNYWGWVSARGGFNTVPDGIKFESELFSPNCNLPPFKDRSVYVKNPCKYYKGKTIKQQLTSYGPHDNPNYAGDIIGYMNKIQ